MTKTPSKPLVINGNKHTDFRGTLFFNNDFDASEVKRFYVIENESTSFVRGWQGHKVEQRWFSAMTGAFEVSLIEVDNWETPSAGLEKHTFILEAAKLDVLHVPKGFVSAIRAVEEKSKLLVMADYLLGEIKDEYRYDSGYFK